MDRNRLMMVAAVLAAVVVVAGGFFVGIQPKLTAASAAQSQQQSVETQNSALASNLATLKSQYSKLDSLNAQLASKQKSLPSTAQSDAMITEINQIAVANHVRVTNITFGTPAAYVAPVVETPAATSTATASASASPSASASASATPAPVASATTPVSPTVATSPLITAANFTDIPLTMEIEGTTAQSVAFLQGLRNGTRLFLVTSVTLTPADSADTTSEPQWTFGGLVYALSNTASTTPTSQTATSTAAGATTGTSSPDAAAGK